MSTLQLHKRLCNCNRDITIKKSSGTCSSRLGVLTLLLNHMSM